jgi:hypothetical protein
MAQTLLAARFAPLPPGRVPTSYDAERVVAPADLDDEQALVLETFVRSPIVWAFGNMRLALNGLGLPADAASLEIFLAARPT